MKSAAISLAGFLLLAVWVPPSAQCQEVPNLESLGAMGGTVGAVFATDDYVIVGQGRRVTIGRWTAEGFAPLGAVTLDGTPSRLFMNGNRVLAARANGFDVIDASDVTAPVRLGSNGFGLSNQPVGGLFAQGGTVYVAQEAPGTSSSFWVLGANASGTGYEVTGRANVDGARDVVVEGTTAYLVAHTNMAAQTGLYLFDVSDPTLPGQVSAVYVSGARRLDVEGSIAYVVGGTNQGISILDVSNRALPVLRSVFGFGTRTYRYVDAVGRMVYLLDQLGDIHILDASDPGNPVEVTRFDPAVPYNFGQDIRARQYPSGQTVLFASTSSVLTVLDVSTAAAPGVYGVLREPSDVRDTATGGSVLAIADGTSVWVYDVTSGTPEYRSRLPFPAANKVAVHGTTLLVADWTNGVGIVDLSDPSSPSLVATYAAPGTVGSLGARGSQCYFLTQSLGATTASLEIVDLSVPAAPTRLGGVELPGNGIDLFVPPESDATNAGRIAVAYHLLAGETGRFALLDVSNPAAVSTLGAWAPQGERPVAVSLAGARAIGASMNAGATHWYLEAYDLADPAAPVRRALTDGDGSDIGDMELMDEQTVAIVLPGAGEIRVLALDWAASKFGDDPATPMGNRFLPNPLLLSTTPVQVPGGWFAYLFATGGFSSYGMPEVSGGYGVYRYRYPVRGGAGQVSLTTAVSPSEAAADGAAVTPSGGMFDVGIEVTLAASVPNGWIFTEWSGDLVGPANPGQLLMDADKMVTANYLPTLVLDLAKSWYFEGCPPDAEQARDIAEYTLTALGTDWLLHGFTLRVPDDVRSLREGVRSARVWIRGQPYVAEINASDDGTLIRSYHVNLGGLTIAEGEVMTLRLELMVFFDYRNENGPCPTPELAEYTVTANRNDVSAEPLPPAARPGVKLPANEEFRSAGVVYGCVLLEYRIGFDEHTDVFASIQDALDDRMGDSSTCRVCPGVYFENVRVVRWARIRSVAGPARTRVEPSTESGKDGAEAVIDFDVPQGESASFAGFHVTGGPTGILVRGAGEVTIGDDFADALERNVVSGNGTGIEFRSSGGVVAGTYVGTNLAGSGVDGNSGAGIYVTGSAGPLPVRIGRQTETIGKPVVVSGNGMAGILVDGPHSVTVRGVRIGTTADGSAALANGTNPLLGVGGVAVMARASVTLTDNVISGNRNFGVYLSRAASRTVVEGNHVGTDSTGRVLPNTGVGLYAASDSNRIGGATGIEANVIASNGSHGMHLAGSFNRLGVNYVGTNADTLSTLGNAGDGIRISGGSNNRFVASDAWDWPIVAFNKGAGIAIEGDGAVGNTIRGVHIFRNEGLGIDLGADGITSNDLGNGTRADADKDRGPNHLLNFPAGVMAVPVPGRADSLLISGFLDTAAPQASVIDVYTSPEPDSTGFGEGHTWIGRAIPDSTGLFRLRLHRLALIYPFLSATATSLPDSSTSEFGWVCRDTDGDGSVDSDGDGLCDDWEEAGIDYDGDGIVDLPLHEAPFSAKSNHKDLFVEIDWMASAARSLQPVRRGLDDVTAAFAAADLANGDGVKGIALHLMTDEAVPWQNRIRFGGTGAGSFLGVKHGDAVNPCGSGATDGHFGTAADRASERCAAILGARHLVFRYALFANEYAEAPTSSGIAEVGGNDFLVTLGSWADNDIKWAGGYAVTANNAVLPTARRRVEAGTFMHEFGHTLGLGHGGQDRVNCKPNYLSIMNYSLQLCSGIPNRVLDYSSFDLADLNEAALDERAGVGGVATRSNLYNQSAIVLAVGPTRSFVADRMIDWDGLDSDGDGIFFNDPSVSSDINHMPGQGCDNGGFATLTTQNDWNNLVLPFRTGHGLAWGAASVGEAGEEPELNPSHVASMARSVDFDGDGFVNALDNCTHIANPTQQDLDGDGIGDVCESRASDLQLFMQPSTDTPRAGTPFEYLLTVHNAGPDSTESVIVVDTLDARYAIEAVTSDTGSCDVGTSSFICDLGGLATFGVLTVTLRVNATEGGMLPNEAWVSSMELDPDTTSNRARLAPSVASGVNNERRDDLPDRFDLLPAYPNPFAVTAIVPFDVREEAAVRLVVYDVLGREVARLVDTRMPAGRHRAVVDGARWAPGVYLARIVMGGYTETTRLVLVR